jgi:hypothetical protein
MRKFLEVGDTVSWRGSWGRDLPKDAKVVNIEVNCTTSMGAEVRGVIWSKVKKAGRSIIVELDNGHWAYANQISQK